MTFSVEAPKAGPVAVIDIGTNSVRLFVADVSDGHMLEKDRAMHQPRLGRGVQRHGRLHPQAIADTLAAVGDLVGRARRWQPAQIVVVGTSALRDAANRDQFIDALWARCGLRVTLLSGEEEAERSFTGAVRGVMSDAAATDVFVVDVGGGSTEIVKGTRGGQMSSRFSADVGAVRMTELCIRDDPPSATDWDCLRLEVERRFQSVWQEMSSSSARDLIGVAGTVTTLAAIDLDLDVYDPRRIHGHRLSLATVEGLLDMLRHTKVEQRRKLPGMQERADIIVAGAYIVAYVMKELNATKLVVSEHDLLQGIVLHERGL